MLGVAAVVALIVIATGGSGELARPPRARAVAGGGADPFSYDPTAQAEYVTRAIAGNGHVLFTKSPGGALATAARVARFRPLIDRATSGTPISPNLLEGLVFVESAGRPQVIAGGDPAAAAGLTQIEAQTAQAMLGMAVSRPAAG